MSEQIVTNILAAVDESDRSDQVVKKTIAMAKAFQAKVVLLHVRPKVPDIFGHPYYQQILDKYIDNANQVVAPHQAALTASGVEYEALILEGDPAKSIIDAAKVEKCDLIIIGSRGLSEIQGLALGSVSHKVLHSTTCMVLVVP